VAAHGPEGSTIFYFSRKAKRPNGLEIAFLSGGETFSKWQFSAQSRWTAPGASCACVQNSQAQCNPLRAFALTGYGKPTVALPRFGAIQNCPVRIAVGEKASAVGCQS
jgi:hypothetical protein